MKFQTHVIDWKTIRPFGVMPKNDGLGRLTGSATGSGWVEGRACFGVFCSWLCHWLTHAKKSPNLKAFVQDLPLFHNQASCMAALRRARLWFCFAPRQMVTNIDQFPQNRRMCSHAPGFFRVIREKQFRIKLAALNGGDVSRFIVAR